MVSCKLFEPRAQAADRVGGPVGFVCKRDGSRMRIYVRTCSLMMRDGFRCKSCPEWKLFLKDRVGRVEYKDYRKYGDNIYV